VAEAPPYRATLTTNPQLSDYDRDSAPYGVGIEARISHLKRSFGLRRARLRRLPGAKTWVGLGIFAYNLQLMTVVAAG
jgi:hypothetical protein